MQRHYDVSLTSFLFQETMTFDADGGNFSPQPAAFLWLTFLDLCLL